jgi:hypothetical protein
MPSRSAGMGTASGGSWISARASSISNTRSSPIMMSWARPQSVNRPSMPTIPRPLTNWKLCRAASVHTITPATAAARVAGSLDASLVLVIAIMVANSRIGPTTQNTTTP